MVPALGRFSDSLPGVFLCSVGAYKRYLSTISAQMTEYTTVVLPGSYAA